MSLSNPSNPLLQAPNATLEQTLDASVGPPVAADLKVAQRLGRFVLLHLLGTGGMGSVFAAYDEQLDRRIALKLLHRRETAQGDQRQHVLREAQAMARVSHPNVVQVYDVGETGERIFIAMEYIDGVTLASWQTQQLRTWQDTLRVYLQAGQGLLAAHRKGLVHRDFKPDNVLIDQEGRARVADFGLARVQGTARADAPDAAPSPLTASGTPATVLGTIAGTPGYMSPEQYRGDPVDSRSDQFSFCAALFEALFQRLPFLGDSTAELAANALAGRRVLPPKGSLVPHEIRAALGRGLAVDPGARYLSMAELLAVLEGKAESDPAATRSVRRLVFAGLLGLDTLAVTAILATYPSGKLTVPFLAAMAAVGLVMLLFFAVVARRSLFTTAFHRGVTILGVIALSTWFGVRCLSLPLHLEVRQLIPIDLMVTGGIWATIAYQYLSGLWWIVGGMVAGAIVAAFRPQNSEQIFLSLYSAWPFIAVYAWNSADGKRREAQKASERPTPDSAELASRQGG